MPPDFLVIGAVAKDLLPNGGWRLGGSVTYASLQASRLGLDTVAVTSCAPDVSPAEAVPSVRWHVIPSPTTMTFENRYGDGRRHQRLLATCTPIEAAHVPPRWREAPAVLLGPLYAEVDVRLGAIFPPASQVGLAAQGWLRRLDGNQVTATPIEGDEPWLIGDTVFLSDEDAPEPERAALWQKHVPTIILTRADAGCTVWSAAGRLEVPAFPTHSVDASGAGDVFAAAYLARYLECQDPQQSARFAAAAAALCVAAPGSSGIGDRAAIEALLATATPAGER
jgi:sugar/nucleoside kinase (ribokinase family)